MRLFDPRKVELRFRALAYVAVCACSSVLLVYCVYHVHRILTAGKVLSTGLTDTWGHLPDLSLCSLSGVDLKFAFVDLYTAQGAFRFGFNNTAHPDDPLNVKVEVMTSTAWSDSTATCCRIKTSCFVPDLAPDSSDYVEIAVSFERAIGARNIRGAPGVSPSLEVDAYAGLFRGLPEYLGTLGYPKPFPVTGNRDVAIWELRKREVRTPDLHVSFAYETTEKAFEYQNPLPPTKRLEVMPGAERYVSEATDPRDPRLYVVHFALSLYATWGLTPLVPVYRWVTKREQIVMFFGSLGGLLSLTAILLSMCFPQKYPYSSVAATYDTQTLLGHQSEKTDIMLDTVSEKFRRWTSPRKSTSVSTEEDHNSDVDDEGDESVRVLAVYTPPSYRD